MSEVRAKTPHGEMSVDQLAEIQPGMAAIMKEVGERYSACYYAAKGGNWKLAAYQLNMVRVSFRTAKVTRPKFTEDLNAFDSEYLLPVFKAIQSQDWAEFEAAFQKGMEGSDVYHDKRGYQYIRFVLPDKAPANLYMGPPEKFTRAKSAKE
ncbi:MAG: hypothetical protein HY247_05300 [archaeon]|nr:MAG: hypothetical protein HY247_05300 [archaeon]